jgi:multiple antibiotic resistance protein
MNNEILIFSLSVFTGFFAVMNPIANVPIFMGIVENEDTLSKKRIAKKAAFTAFIIVVSFVLFGKFIFELFDITIPAFKITGGILIFYIGFEMLLSKKSKVHNHEAVKTDDGIAVSPLAIPILAGPGTIVTAMNFVTNASIIHITIVIIVFMAMILLTYLAFSASEFLVKVFGKNLILVIAKLMGLILAIIGTGMIVTGIKLAFDI